MFALLQVALSRFNATSEIFLRLVEMAIKKVYVSISPVFQEWKG
jgi:hypothetical protein